jgi:predicted nucleotidyltransferase
VSDRLKRILSELRSRLSELYGDRLERLVLYGSHARGDARVESDIDVLVVLKGTVRRWEESRRTSEIRADISLRNNTVISCMYVSANDYQKDDEPLLTNVRREGIAV